MPSTSAASANISPVCESFISPYSTQTSYKNLSELLNRRLTIAGKSPQRTAQLSLLDLLKALDLRIGAIKGSTALQWPAKPTSSDLDMQFAVIDAERVKDFPRKIADFMEACCTNKDPRPAHTHEKQWLAKVAQEMRNQWSRLIVSVGYPGANTSTLDLNFTNQRTLAYDAIHASKALQFDVDRRNATILNSWHPSLVKWVQKNKLLWFNPEIDEGLNRISYRLSKSNNLQLLQPSICVHVLARATPNSLGNIYLRILQGEYSGASLSLQERGSLWLHAIRAASETPNGNLAQELLLWSKYSTLEQLAHALAKSPPLVGLIDTLTLGAKVGANFTNALKAQLGKQNDLQTQLQPLIDRALGAQCINGTALFAAIDAWEELEEVPEQELQAMLRESLTALKEGPCPLAAQRALHMLGWLDNDAMCTLEFWIDRLPSQATPSDKEACMSKVLQSIEKVIEKHGTSGMAPVMDRLSQLPLSKDDWRTIIADMPGRAHMSDGAHTVEAINNNPALAFLDWLQTHTTTLAALPSSRAPGLGTAQAVMPTQGLFTQTVSMARQLLACTVPPMLQAIVQIKSDTMHIQIGDIDLQIASGLDRITAKTGRQTHWIGEQMYAQLKPQENANASDTFRMVLRDGTLITGTATKTGPFIVEGILSCIGAAQTPAGLAGLLQQGRALASTQFQEYGLEQHFWTAEGSFSATGLLKSNNTLDALRSLKQGLIVERSATSSLRIEHEIKDNAPHTCKVMAMGDKWQSHSQIKYRCEPDELANYPALSNVWNAIVSEDKAEAHQLIHIPPLGPVKLSSSVPFSISQQSADGWIELQSQGPTPFRWLGRMEGGRCLQFGSLHVDRQRTPAITFDAGEQADHLPITLLPVMADLLGKHLQGQYPFKPAIWQDSSRWPTAGFEGFVHRQQHGPYTFSGYLTATGRAIGILGLSNAGTSTTYDLAWSGSFMVTPTHGIVRHPIELDNLDPSFVGLEVSPTEALLPHGLVRAQFLDRNTQKSRARIDRVYFCGEGMAYTTITQSRDLIYDSPSMTRYFVGVEYSRKNKPMHIDLVINPGDGGHDFVIIRPKTYEKEKLYQMLYHDELGTKASYVIKDRQYSMVDITFPSGMQYIGQIITEQSSCKLIDKGKISFGKLSFAIETERTGRIRSIRGLNEDSTHWVDTYTSQNRAPNFAVENLVELMSGGMLLWQTHVQPHLVLRDLQAHQANAVVFSRS